MTSRRRAKLGIGVALAACVGGLLAGLSVPALKDRILAQHATAAAQHRDTVQRRITLAALNALAADLTPMWPADPVAVASPAERGVRLNPFARPGQPDWLVDPEGNPEKHHPVEKTIEGRMAAGQSGAIWYNPENGTVRFCIPRQRTEQATLALYNRVNACAATDLHQTSP